MPLSGCDRCLRIVRICSPDSCCMKSKKTSGGCGQPRRTPTDCGGSLRRCSQPTTAVSVNHSIRNSCDLAITPILPPRFCQIAARHPATGERSLSAVQVRSRAPRPAIQTSSLDASALECASHEIVSCRWSSPQRRRDRMVLHRHPCGVRPTVGEIAITISPRLRIAGADTGQPPADRRHAQRRPQLDPPAGGGAGKAARGGVDCYEPPR